MTDNKSQFEKFNDLFATVENIVNEILTDLNKSGGEEVKNN
jgi:hypothetical protein